MRNHPACDLFQRCFRERSPEDWRLFIERYEPRLRCLVRGATTRSSTSDHEELLQELYVRLWTARSFQGATENQLWNWIRCIARHMVVDLHLADRRHRRLYERLSTLNSRTPSAPSPEDRFLARERLTKFSAHFRDIVRHGRTPPQDAWRILCWTLGEGYSSLEVSRFLRGRLTPVSVDQVLYRLRKRLARRGVQLTARRS